MDKEEKDRQRRANLPFSGGSSAMDVVSEYSVAIATADIKKMNDLQSDDFVLDWVHSDAFENPSSQYKLGHCFWWP